LRKGIQLQREYHEKIAKALKNPDRALLEMEKANNSEEHLFRESFYG
jgi:hypothetical protein